MAEKKNYYEILGVSKDASDEEIKAAYKKLVKQYHPDLHPGDRLAAEKFKEINEANEVLSDKQKRAAYDYEREHPGMGGMGGMGGAGFGGFGFGDIFESIFQGFGGGASVRRDNTGEPIQIDLTLSFMDAAKGCRRDISYMRNEPCPACGGTGAKNGMSFRKCARCEGRGQLRYTQETPFGRTVRVGACPECNGKGRVIVEKCADCKGRGYLRRETKLTIEVPAGADTNSYIRKRGYGQAGADGAAARRAILSSSFTSNRTSSFRGRTSISTSICPFPSRRRSSAARCSFPGWTTHLNTRSPRARRRAPSLPSAGRGSKRATARGTSICAPLWRSLPVSRGNSGRRSRKFSPST